MADKPEFEHIEIEVVYALPGAQTIVTLIVPAGTTVAQAIARSGIAAQHPEIEWGRIETAVFGKRVSLVSELNACDRVEICRPLIANPKQVRRRRARQSPGGGR